MKDKDNGFVNKRIWIESHNKIETSCLTIADCPYLRILFSHGALDDSSCHSDIHRYQAIPLEAPLRRFAWNNGLAETKWFDSVKR